MKVNPDKCQSIIFSKSGNGLITYFKCGTTHVKCEDYVVLIVIEHDHMLTFNDHIPTICKKSARKLAVLKRLGHLLTLQWKVAFLNILFRQISITPL